MSGKKTSETSEKSYTDNIFFICARNENRTVSQLVSFNDCSSIYFLKSKLQPNRITAVWKTH